MILEGHTTGVKLRLNLLWLCFNPIGFYADAPKLMHFFNQKLFLSFQMFLSNLDVGSFLKALNFIFMVILLIDFIVTAENNF